MADSKNGANLRNKNKAMAAFLEKMGIERKGTVAPCCHKAVFTNMHALTSHIGLCQGKRNNRKRFARV